MSGLLPPLFSLHPDEKEIKDEIQSESKASNMPVLLPSALLPPSILVTKSNGTNLGSSPAPLKSLPPASLSPVSSSIAPSKPLGLLGSITAMMSEANTQHPTQKKSAPPSPLLPETIPETNHVHPTNGTPLSTNDHATPNLTPITKTNQENQQTNLPRDEAADELRSAVAPSLYKLFKSPGSLTRDEINSQIRSISSAPSQPKGPILKFSEIFAPPPPSRGFIPRKKSKAAPIPPTDLEDMCESEEEEVFTKFEETSEIGIDGVVKLSKKTDESEYMAQPLKEGSKSSKDIVAVAPEAFDPVQQYSWEDDILWEKPKDRKMNNMDIDMVPSKPAPSKPRSESQPKRSLWGSLLPDPPKIEPPSEPKDPMEIGFPAPIEPAIEDPKKISSAIPPPSDDHASHGALNTHAQPAFTNPNLELASGDWLKSIIWDDRVNPVVAPQTELILDLNDKAIFPENVDLDALEKSSKPTDKTPREKKRKAEQLEEEVDPFNLSNDPFYANANKAKSRQKLGKTMVLHSEPALKLSLVKPSLSTEDLVHFHRPHTKLRPREIVKVQLIRRERAMGELSSQNNSRSEVMRHKGDLTAREGRIILAEYVEQYPLTINNVGMGTKLKNFYRRKNPSENPLLRFEDGENVLLDPTEESPFLGDIEPGKTVQAFDNNLFRAPIFKQNTSDTDFLLIRCGKRAYIREIPAAYTVGQAQPKMEVHAYNSRVDNNYMKSRLQAYIYRLFMKNSTQQRLRISDILGLFPKSSETSVRKRLKDCADFQRGGDDSGWWTVKDQSQLPNEDELRSMVTPEHVVLHESMQHGLYRLQQSGIVRFTGITPAFISAIQHLDQEADISIRKAAHRLEEELQLTPWNLTSNFVNAIQGKGVLQLSGLGDPSGRGEAYSFVKVPQKGASKKINKEKETIGPKSAGKFITGTDADLRKLSLEAAKQILLSFGVPEDEIQRLSRWERIGLVRKKSSEAAAAGEGGVTKFARGSRYSLQQQHSQYTEQIQMIWENQIRALSDPDPQFSDDEDEDEDEFDDFGKDLENLLTVKGGRRGKRNRREEEEDEAEEEKEKREYEKLMQDHVEWDENSEKSGKDRMLNNTNFTLVSDADASDPNKKKFIRKTVVTKNPDGTTSKKVELITDPAQIEILLKKEKDRKSRMGINRPPKQHLTPEEEERKNKMRREKRRLQEQLRRLRRNKEKQNENREKMLAGSSESDVPSDGNKYRCGACGLVGHMRTNRNCPLWVEPVDNGDAVDVPEVKVEGTKLRISKEAFRTTSSDSLVLRFKNNKDAISLDEDDELNMLNRQKKRSRRTGSTGAQVAMSNLFEKILNKIKEHQYAHPFLNPVPLGNKIAPRYYDIIKNPMDLSTIREKIRTFAYASRTDFLDDMKLMVNNCYSYNADRNPHLLPMVDALYQLAETEIQEVDAELVELEKAAAPEEEEGKTPSLSTPSMMSSTSSLVISLPNDFGSEHEEVDVMS
eukprot:TRINITY_DN4508_c0_g1_i1.p1 TRINITY_DN4508_c0_g1~~TRINITY_DN4508_c0_g1_i1.p1  ORF type:complete len:1471 (+),score=537.36 TRINITY_DN4508_c0_g1_i1:58-4470(+)